MSLLSEQCAIDNNINRFHNTDQNQNHEHVKILSIRNERPR